MIAYLTGCLALCLSPGPDMLFIMSRALSHGRAAGLASAAGVVTGATVHLVVAAAGLSIALSTMPALLSALSLAGGAYMMYLGAGTIRRGVHIPAGNAAQADHGAWQHFKQGLITDVLNPKVALFYVAFIPPFVDPLEPNKPLRIVALGMILNLVGIIVNGGVALFAARAADALGKNPRVASRVGFAAGATLMAVGAFVGVRGLWPQSFSP